METITMTNSQRFSLGQWLADYPTDLSYEQIIDILETETGWIGNKYENLCPWEIIEDYPAQRIAEFIEDTRKAFERYTSD